MAKRSEKISPVGPSVSEDIAGRLQRDATYRAEHERLAGFEQLARIVITRRAELEISQEELARRMGTTASVVSRIKRGQHATNTRTLKRLAEALGGHALIGFEFGTRERPERAVVVL